MTAEQRAREFVEVGFRDLGVPSLEPYVQIIAELIAGAEKELRAEIERLTAALTTAPRPSVSGDEGWPVQYMDWFFKTRMAALKDTKP